jgi:hypothetical protein
MTWLWEVDSRIAARFTQSNIIREQLPFCLVTILMSWSVLFIYNKEHVIST